LDRAIPLLAEEELAWWTTNRTVSVTSLLSNVSHTVFRYGVVDSAPRPEVSRLVGCAVRGAVMMMVSGSRKREIIWLRMGRTLLRH
jgi:hypothetical protein